MTKYAFLTEEWVTEVKRLRDEYGDVLAAPEHGMKMNQIVTGVPHAEEDVKVYMDTSQGDVKTDFGHLDDPDLTVTLDYDTARAILVEQDPAAGMQAFMAGKIKVQGDMSKMMALQGGVPNEAEKELANKIKDMTA